MCAVVEHVHDQIITAGSELQRLLWLRQDASNWMQLGWRRLSNGSPQIPVSASKFKINPDAISCP